MPETLLVVARPTDRGCEATSLLTRATGRLAATFKNKMRPLASVAATAVLLAASSAAGLTFTAPGLDPAHLRVTVLADNLNYPVGMSTLDDGSLLVGTTNDASYFAGGSGSILRLVDGDGDGVAEQRQPLVGNVPGGNLSALRRAGALVAVTGQGSGAPISIYRLSVSPAVSLTYLGGMTINYPSGGWLHPHSALALRQDAGDPNRYELYFQLGSDTNFAGTTRTATLSGSFGAAGTLAGDSVHRIVLTDGPGGLTAGAPVRIARGLRNATGLAFQPGSGDLYLGENGIDGVVDPNEPISADEIDVVAAGVLGVQTPDFGFPATYEQYRTGVTIGASGVPPATTFQPLPPPDGSEAEGVNEIAFSPALFPAALADGLFAGFHGRFFLGGVANEENPLAFVPADGGSVVHVVPNGDATVGHLDGLWSTRDTLYVADISTNGGLSGAAQNTGKVYAIKSLLALGDYERDGDVDGGDLLAWQRQLSTPTGAFYRADGDGDGVVDAGDLAPWQANFGQGAAAAAGEVPEPSFLAGLLVLGLSAGFRRSNRVCFGNNP